MGFSPQAIEEARSLELGPILAPVLWQKASDGLCPDQVPQLDTDNRCSSLGISDSLAMTHHTRTFSSASRWRDPTNEVSSRLDDKAYFDSARLAGYAARTGLRM